MLIVKGYSNTNLLVNIYENVLEPKICVSDRLMNHYPIAPSQSSKMLNSF